MKKILEFKQDGDLDKFGPRAGVIYTSEKEINRIPTPLKVLNSNELDAGEKIRKSGLAEPVFPHPIMQIVKGFGKDTLINLKNNGRVYHSQMRTSLNYSHQFTKKLSTFHPIFPKDYAKDKKLSDVMIDLQLESDIEIVTVINVDGLSKDNFSKLLGESREKIENSDGGLHVREVVPIVPLNLKKDRLESKLKVISDMEFKMIDFDYFSPLQYWENYQALIKFRDKHDDVLMHISQLPKFFGKNIKSSVSHVLQVIGDSFSLRVARPFEKDKNYRIEWKDAKIFDRNSLAELKAEEYRKLNGDKLDGCSVCDAVDNSLTTFSKSYDPSMILTPALKTHGTLSSFSEFLKGRKYIKEGRFKEYAMQKKYLKLGIRETFGLDADTKLLSSF